MSKWSKKSKDPTAKPYIRSVRLSDALKELLANQTDSNIPISSTKAEQETSEEETERRKREEFKRRWAEDAQDDEDAEDTNGLNSDDELDATARAIATLHPTLYPLNIPAVANLGQLEFDRDVTFFIGENGAGKSTILEAAALAFGFPSEGGSIQHTYEGGQTVSDLHSSVVLQKGLGKPHDSFFLRAESFYNFATFIDSDFHQKSHGEAFLSLLNDRFRGNGLYLLDEPEAALSPNRQLAALVRIHDLVQQNSQFVIATHSPILLAYPNAKIIQFDSKGWSQVEYEETEHFAVTKYFLNNYQRQIQRLLINSDEKSDY